MARALGVVCIALTFACGSVDPDRVQATLRLPTAPECQPASLGTISITALGDFPTSDATVEVIGAGGAPRELGRFPQSTLALSARASAPSWEGFGVTTVDQLRTSDELVLLPIGRSCALSDAEARLPEGAALAILSPSSVLLAGGLGEGRAATRRLTILEVRSEHVEILSPTLLNTTAYASATVVPGGGAVLIAGGASGDDGEVRDTWESVSLEDETRVFPARPLETARREHAAIALSAGDLTGVLLVGGSDGASALDTLELVDVDSRTSRTLTSRLTRARIAPSVAFLSSVIVAVFGGRNDAGEPVPGIDLLDLTSESISPASAELGPAEWAVALPDGRIAASVEGHVQIAVSGASRVVDAGLSPAVVDPVATAQLTSHVLVAGRDSRGERLAVIFDPGTGLSSPVPIAPVPTALVALPDGTTLALDEAGASIRRDDRRTPFDSPPPLYLFAEDRSVLALDAASRWDVDDDVLVARAPGARVGVPVLSFRNLRASLDAEGPAEISLVDALGDEVLSVDVDEVSASFGDCIVERVSSAPVTVVRQGAEIELSADGRTTRCAAPGLPERVGVSIVGHTDTRLRSLALARLP